MTKKEKEILFRKEREAYNSFKFRESNYGKKDELTIQARYSWTSFFEIINVLGLYEESYEWRHNHAKNN